MPGSPFTHATYAAADFAALITRETDRLELKTSASSGPLQEAMVAFSNTDGGVIVLGVDDRRTVLGRSLDQGTDDQIHQAAARAHQLGTYRVRELRVDGTPIVAIEVDARTDGFSQTSNGRILVRRGASNQAVFGDDVWRLASERVLRRFETTDTQVTFRQVEPTELERVCTAFDWDPSDPALTTRLRERGLMRSDDELTVAGALVLTDPARTLRTSKFVVELRWFGEGSDEFRRRHTVGGSLPTQIISATRLLMDELGTDPVVIGVRRWDLPRLPGHVVREAVANAVAHRAYDHDRTAVIVEIRPDRVVVSSPGRLMPGVTVDNLRHAQAARNPATIGVLRRFALTEDAGLGVDRMQDGMSEEMLDPPLFEEVGEFMRVTLPMSGPVTPRERAWLKDLESDGILDRADRLLLVHAARREPALALVTEGPMDSVRLATVPRRLTNTEARRITGLDRDAALAALRRLRDHGFLSQHGSRGGAYYLLDRGLIRGAAHGMTDEEIDEIVLEAASAGPLRNEDVRILTGLDRAAVSRLLGRLVAGGRLVRSGQRRGTTYAKAEHRSP